MSIHKKYLTEEHLQRNKDIIALWNKGLTGQEIARRLGLKSRRVVVGVVNRAKAKGVITKSRDRGEEAKPVDEVEQELPLPDAPRTMGSICEGLIRTSQVHYAPPPGGWFRTSTYPPKRKPIPRIEDADMDVIGIELTELSRKQCKWPLWSDEDTHRKCCGRDTTGRKVYCEDHEARAWQHGTL